MFGSTAVCTVSPLELAGLCTGCGASGCDWGRVSYDPWMVFGGSVTAPVSWTPLFKCVLRCHVGGNPRSVSAAQRGGVLSVASVGLRLGLALFVAVACFVGRGLPRTFALWGVVYYPCAGAPV